METGYSVLETEYKSVVQKNTIQADPVVVIESLDDQYGSSTCFTFDRFLFSPCFDANIISELMGSHVKNIKTVRELTTLTRLGVWLLERERTRFLSHYAKIR